MMGKDSLALHKCFPHFFLLKLKINTKILKITKKKKTSLNLWMNPKIQKKTLLPFFGVFILRIKKQTAAIKIAAK